MRKQLLLCLISLLCLASCDSEEETDWTVFGKRNEDNFIIDPGLKVYYRYYDWGFTNDGAEYLKCRNTESDQAQGPWIKEKNPVFEQFALEYLENLFDGT